MATQRNQDGRHLVSTQGEQWNTQRCLLQVFSSMVAEERLKMVHVSSEGDKTTVIGLLHTIVPLHLQNAAHMTNILVQAH